MSERLRELLEALKRNGDTDLAARISVVLEVSDADLEAFLVSNELWGGAGSIADQAGVGGGRSALGRGIEAALIQLGDEQMQNGKVNPRTAMWLEAFKEWRRNGI
jgi:hypothetical protein